jgi:hypothetical protein
VERAEQEVVARRARRVLWGFRLAFSVGAAAVLALVFSGGGGKRFSDTELHGQTSAGEPVRIVLEDDRPDVIETHIAATCPDGDRHEVRWFAHAGHTAEFELDDETLRITDEVGRRYEDSWTGRRWFELRADFDGKSVRGSIRFAERVWRPDFSSYVCEAEPVSFSAD